jgi:CheY-like chemotaxis protein
MATRRPKVLIVDDEDEVVLSLFRALYQDNHRYDVLLARSAEIAEQILGEGRVDVLVTDVHLPEKSGLDLLHWVAVQAPSTRVIVMTAFDVGIIRDRAHTFGCLRLVRKPFDVLEMRAAILQALTQRSSFRGSLSELSCVDVVQMLCLARKSTALRLSQGRSAGVIHIERGEPVHAVWDDLGGEEAFFRMLGVKHGVFSTGPLPPDGDHTLRGDWQYLVIEGLRRLDEVAAGQRDAPEADRQSLRISFTAGDSSLPPPRASLPDGRIASPPPESATIVRSGATGETQRPAPEASAAPVSPDVSRLVDEGFQALRAGRREDARRVWEEALRLSPDNRAIELNLRKLGAPVAAGRS